MGDAPYQPWRDWFACQPGSGNWRIADVGCGTGVLTVDLAKAAAQVFGVDISEMMLTQAAKRAGVSGVHVQWLCQDMRSLQLPHPVNAIVSTCDSMNYLRTPEDFGAALHHFYTALQPNGKLCFDLLGPARLTKLAQGCFYDLRDESEVWFTSEVDSSGAIHYEVHAYRRVDEARQLYERIVEQHRQQYFGVEQVKESLVAAGFKLQAVKGDFGTQSFEDADRVAFFAVKGP